MSFVYRPALLHHISHEHQGGLVNIGHLFLRLIQKVARKNSRAGCLAVRNTVSTLVRDSDGQYLPIAIFLS